MLHILAGPALGQGFCGQTVWNPDLEGESPPQLDLSVEEVNGFRDSQPQPRKNPLHIFF